MVKRYLVTGMPGFVAPHMAKTLLKEGYEVHGLMRGGTERKNELLGVMSGEEIDSVKFQYADLTDRQDIEEIIQKNQYQGVFHLGAQSHQPTSHKDLISTFKSNIMGTANLIDAIRNYSPETIFQFTSTSVVYGNLGKDGQVLTEDTPFDPIDPYGVSKIASELQMEERTRNGLINGYTARPFSHTGPGRPRNFSIACDAYNLAMLMNGKNPNEDMQSMEDLENIDPMKSISVGNLTPKRSVIDVRDCVEAYKQLMFNFKESLNGEVYNVCGEIKDVSPMQKFTDILIEESGLEGIVQVKDKRFFRPVKTDIQVQIGDTQKITNLTGWKPQIPIKDTLRDLLDYWKQKVEDKY